MLYQTFDITLSPVTASLVLGALIGVLFGAAAWISRFCLRRAVVAPGSEGRAARGVWMTALLAALLATQTAVYLGFVDFGAHRFTAENLPWLAAILGGGLFGAGMVLARGCLSRLTVLGGAGNLRALTVVLVAAVVAHAAMKGILSPIRVAVTGVTFETGGLSTLAALPGGALIWTGLIALGLLAAVWRSGARNRDLGLAAFIGLLAAAGWIGTGFVLFDDFDPIELETLAFTGPITDGLFYAIAGTSIPAGFGVGIVAGTLFGAFAIAAVWGGLKLESFTSPRETLRYISGAGLMGLGGVLAGGCTVGAGLSGVPTLSIAAILALVSIIAGARLTHAALSERPMAGFATPAE